MIFSKVFIFQNYETDREKITELLNAMSRNNRTFESLNCCEKTLSLVCRLDGEINNGGFSQYYFNTDGAYIQDTTACLQSIKAADCLELFEEANSIFYSDISEEEKHKRWEELDRKYYQLDDKRLYQFMG